MQPLAAALLLLLLCGLTHCLSGGSNDYLYLDVTSDGRRCVGQELDQVRPPTPLHAPLTFASTLTRQEDVATFYLGAFLLSSKDGARLAGSGYKGMGVAATLTDPDDAVIMDERLPLTRANSVKVLRTALP